MQIEELKRNEIQKGLTTSGEVGACGKKYWAGEGVKGSKSRVWLGNGESRELKVGPPFLFLTVASHCSS